MYIRLNMFSSEAASARRWRGWPIALLPSSGHREDSRASRFFEADAGAGEVGSLSIWTPGRMLRQPTRLDAAVQQAMGGAGLQVRGTPIRRIGEVIEPKA